MIKADLKNNSDTARGYDFDRPFIYLDDIIGQAKGAHPARFYDNPVDIIRADDIDAIEAAFEKLKHYHQAGYYLAGYTSYELGLWLEPVLRPLIPSKNKRDVPFIHFAVFSSYSTNAPIGLLYSSDRPEFELNPAWGEADYKTRYQRIQNYLKAGDCYQINLTFPMHGDYDGDPVSLFARLRHRQRARFSAFLRLEDGDDKTDILSLSPELFFTKHGDDITMQPMKGTLPRHSDPELDLYLRDEMAQDPKSQAENLMIVDLLRNDLSRLSRAGSVKVPELFKLETYPTLHQMTSKITAKLHDDIGFRDIFTSLFPCGSVTGAPKIRAMEIIDELEDTPRNAYCGAVGYIDPNGESCFNVAIRTLTLQKGHITYNVGSGVVLESDGRKEYEECLLKSDIFNIPKPYFIETFYYDHDEGYRHIGDHLARLSEAVGSADKMNEVIEHLAAYTPHHSPARIRLTVSDEAVTLTDTEFQALASPIKIAISKHYLSETVQNFMHKGSDRDFYDGERLRLQSSIGIDEVVFFNDAGELCEGSFTNVFLEMNGRLYTPSLKSGLLGGILRQTLIQKGDVIERRLDYDDLLNADKIYVGNSLRGLMETTLMSPRPI